MRNVKELISGNPMGGAFCPFKEKGNRVNLVALGDVGAILLTGLKLLGGEVIGSIGIFDVNEKMSSRFEIEMNQIGWPFDEEGEKHIAVEKITQEKLFDCDVFVFCASKAVPKIGAAGDVRMAQLDANREIVKLYARMAKEKEFKGIFAVVSDPVDPLCNAVLKEAGLHPCQVQGFGLGVMNMRAKYYAEKEEKFASYLTEGRAFGPHGADLVIANSIEAYDDDLSKELTKLVVEANLKVRELGFKPYFAPAISSGAISIILMLKKRWHYSSLYFGEAFLGIKNIMTENGPIFENLQICEELYERIEYAYKNLCAIG